MLDVAPTELLMIAVVALLVIGPKDLPKAMRFVGHWVGKARGVARQFRAGFDTMVREAELAEMEKKWADENARIMREHPVSDVGAHPASDTVAPEGADSAAGADRPTGTDAAASAPGSGVPSAGDDVPAPVMVEQPVIRPARDTTPAVDGKAPS